jgi:hypothetical protein
MAGDDGSGTPKDFHECVSQDQLRQAIKQGQQVMTNTITQAITAAIKDLRLHESIERLDKRISTLTDRVVALETRPPPNEDQDVVYDVHGNTDEPATRDTRLRHRLRTNTIGMGGNRIRAPNDPYAKINTFIF